MNEKPSNYTQEQLCLLYIIGLRYALAGDLESIEHVDFLEQRWRAIRWDDPEFIRFTEEMCPSIPQLTPEQEKALSAPLLAIIHAQGERIAGDNENARILSGNLKKIIKQMLQNITVGREAWAQVDRLSTYAKKLTGISIKMRDRLEVLGDDTSVFELPEI